jgi:hypothetical protein
LVRNEFHAAKKQLVGEGPVTGALPDFLIIGGKKCGTSSLYHLLTRHPHVKPAASKQPHFLESHSDLDVEWWYTKEVHFFDKHFDLGIEWYRGWFPEAKWKDGRRTITGEATPAYLFYPCVPARVAEVVPQARLIALLRNPIDRAYSDYQQRVRQGREPRTFDETVAEALEAGVTWPPRNLDETRHLGDLPRSVYVDQLVNWSKFFPKKKMLVLKSEDFFERPKQILRAVLGFLGLPDWEPQAREVVNKGTYEGDIDPATRRTLEQYFGPHNRRLYDYLGTDFGW